MRYFKNFLRCVSNSHFEESFKWSKEHNNRSIVLLKLMEELGELSKVVLSEINSGTENSNEYIEALMDVLVVMLDLVDFLNDNKKHKAIPIIENKIKNYHDKYKKKRV